jgi:SAM-dependent methyltransferase
VTFESESVKFCRICKSQAIAPYLDLGLQPPSNSFVYSEQVSSEQKFPLQICLCQNCGLSQLSHNVNHLQIFDEYAYRSSTSRALVSSFRETTKHISNYFNTRTEKVNLIDVGCNDGLLLEQCDLSRFNVFGIEPSNVAKVAIEKGLAVEQIFLNKETSLDIVDRKGCFDAVVVTNVLAHVPNIEEFVTGVSTLLCKNGIWVVEFPYILDMIENLTFDTIYHEHFSYLSVTPLLPLFNRQDLWIIDIQMCEVGGSGPYMRLTCIKGERKDFWERQAHATESFIIREKILGLKDLSMYQHFQDSVMRHKSVLIEKINKLKDSGEVIGAYGAPAKGNTLLNFLNLSSKDIVAIADNTPEKIGRLTPGSHIPIVSDEEFLSLGVKTALLLSWNYLSYFRQNATFFNLGGRFLVPFPTPRIEKKSYP